MKVKLSQAEAAQDEQRRDFRVVVWMSAAYLLVSFIGFASWFKTQRLHDELLELQIAAARRAEREAKDKAQPAEVRGDEKGTETADSEAGGTHGHPGPFLVDVDRGETRDV